MAHYQPPKQSKISQLIDVLVLLVLSIGALYLPVKLGLAGASVVHKTVENPTWESLGQNPVQAGQYEALGLTPESAADLITARFDYSFSWVSLAIMVIVVVGYFVMMLKLSETEYREVIAEKFGER